MAAWSAVIAQWMGEHQMVTVPLVQLQRALGMPLAQLWLGLLLGGYHMEQRGEFYETGQLWFWSGVEPPINVPTWNFLESWQQEFYFQLAGSDVARPDSTRSPLTPC